MRIQRCVKISKRSVNNFRGTVGNRKSHRVPNQTNMEDVQALNCVYRQETSLLKGRCELGHCHDAASSCCSSRDSAASSSLVLSVWSKPQGSTAALLSSPQAPTQQLQHTECKKRRKTINITFRFDLLILAFFVIRDAGDFQCIDCLFVSGLYWKIHVMTFSNKSDFCMTSCRMSVQMSFWFSFCSWDQFCVNLSHTKFIMQDLLHSLC